MQMWLLCENIVNFQSTGDIICLLQYLGCYIVTITTAHTAKTAVYSN